MQSIINFILLRFSISARIAAFKPLERLYQKFVYTILHLLSLIPLKIKFLYNFVNYITQYALFNDIKIIIFECIYIK